ncbi:hypothetical protein ACWJKU_14280 [Methylocaldum sp. MU1018]
MHEKQFWVSACIIAGMILSASASADMTIKSGTGRTQAVVEASIHYDDLGNDDIGWPPIAPNYEGDTQLGEMVVKLDKKMTLMCAVMGKGYDLQVVSGSNGPILLPNGQPLIVPGHLRHIITCTDSQESPLSRLSTDGDTLVDISPTANPCRFAVTEVMHAKAPQLTVPLGTGTVSVPGNTGLFGRVTGGTLTIKGTIDACAGQNVFTSITGRLQTP